LTAGDARWRLAGYVLVTLLATFTYFYGLDSQHIPKNGDEYPYEHITRLTAGSGALLPLRSNLPNMRNTKPPLLFWQGIASTEWGRDWTLWSLRYPSVVYTLLTALLVFVLGFKLSGGPGTGFRAMLSFLAFFSTYRYGRPFLTNPPEVFWLFLPFFALLYWRPAGFSSRFVFPLLMGVAVGIALLYRSFALVLPVGLGLAWWYLRFRGYRVAAFLAKDAGKVAFTMSIALAIFASWFLLDPDPQSVWKEFVVGENLGRLDLHGYPSRLLWGGSSIWSLVLGYPLNAGLLAFPVMALFLIAGRRRGELSDGEKLLWIWILVLFLAFSLPSPRSSRYLLAAMPALAVLLAIGWQRIGRWVFALSLLLTAAVIVAIALLSLRLQYAMPGLRPYPTAYWALPAGAGAIVLLGLFVPALTRAVVHAGVLLAYLSFGAFLRPFDGPLGHYDAGAQRYAQGRDVWVPYDFIAKDERYRFLLPGANVHGYREERGLPVTELVARYPLVAVPVPLQSLACETCTIVGRRLDIRGRQTAAELAEILKGKVSPHLFVEELLIEARGAGPASTLAGGAASPR
jgi:4-amino-4-deoxy-L-arabinose transferase-like glycosyltransferase